jgi:transmembrane sensor
MSELDSIASITEQACHWCILLNGGNATQADQKAFGEWVARSPERIEAYIQAARLTKALKSRKLRWPSTPIETLVREAKEAPAEVVSLFSSGVVPQAKPPLRQSRRKPPLMFALAATLVVALACTWVFLTGSQRYATAVGEQRSVVLSDGSVVTLNTSSVIQVKLTKTARIIHLVSGEALFQVAHDKARPFDVIAGNATVRAVGTQFNVERKADGATVTVVEGKVSVQNDLEKSAGKNSKVSTAIPLSAGEGVTVAPRARLQPTSVNVATATAWTQRRLVFEHRPLGEVVDEFNRYNRQKIQIESPELQGQEITGVFQANDPNSLLDFIAKIPGVRIEREGSIIKVILAN